MSNDDIFAPDPFAIDPSKNYLEELVGEGKKFNSPEELARGKAESDAFINQLQMEQEQLRNELKTRLNLEQFLNDLKTVVPKPNNDDSQGHREQPEDKSVMSDEELAARVRQQLMNMKGQETAATNIASFSQAVQSAYGPNAATKLRSQAAEVGMSVDDLKAMAARSPKAALKLIGVGEQKVVDTFNPPPRSQGMSLPAGNVKRGKAYYDEIYRKSPNEFFTPKIQNERMAMIREMGIEAFNNS